jgi:hypothetical protein
MESAVVMHERLIVWENIGSEPPVVLEDLLASTTCNFSGWPSDLFLGAPER